MTRKTELTVQKQLKEERFKQKIIRIIINMNGVF